MKEKKVLIMWNICTDTYVWAQSVWSINITCNHVEKLRQIIQWGNLCMVCEWLENIISNFGHQVATSIRFYVTSRYCEHWCSSMPFIVKYGILLLLLHIQVCLWEFVCKWLLRAGNMREILYYTIINWLTIL